MSIINWNECPPSIGTGVHFRRNTHQNGTARIMGGATLRDWFQDNFSLGQIVEVHFQGPRQIQLSAPGEDFQLAKYEWSKLNHLQIGRYAEYLVKMQLTQYGLDVYTSEVDDRGIDFVLRLSSVHYIDIQVKAVRKMNYIFLPKSIFHPRDNLFAAIVLFQEDSPADHYLIPSTAWLDPNSLLVSRNYEGAASKPEWGLNISQRNMELLEDYSFEKSVHSLIRNTNFGSP